MRISDWSSDVCSSDLQAEDASKALGRWAAASPDHDTTLPLSAASLMMSFRTMFDPERAEDLALTGSIRIGEECFVAEVKEKVLTVERGDAKSPDFAIAAPSAMPIAAMVYGKVPPGALTEAGLKLDGDKAIIGRFIDLFHLPEKAS